MPEFKDTSIRDETQDVKANMRSSLMHELKTDQAVYLRSKVLAVGVWAH